MLSTTTPVPTTQLDLVAHSPVLAHDYDHVASPAPRSSVIPDDSDDEIVWPGSSRSSAASTSPVAVKDVNDRTLNFSTGSTTASYCDDLDDKSNDNDTNKHDTSNVGGHCVTNPFVDDFVLERGDCGSKVWTPPPSVQRLRRNREPRPTKSESALPAPHFSGSDAARKPVKESWADDMKGLEEQMARVGLTEPPACPLSTTSALVTQTLQIQGSRTRKQRSQKKQRRSQPSIGNPTSVTKSNTNNSTAAARAYPSPVSSPTSNRSSPSRIPAVPKARTPVKTKKGKGRRQAKKRPSLEVEPSTAPSTPHGLGTRSIVDDVSDNGDALLRPMSVSARQSETDQLLDVAYDEAVKFMNAFIQHPDYYTSRASRLTFLQALIVELGLVSATGPERTLPESLTAAKALLKTHAFLNVKDYLALRERGLDALRSAMWPSRSALVRDLRVRNGRRGKLGWIKETGLNVLLVSCQY